MSLLCTFPATRTICRKLVAKGLRSRLAMWVLTFIPSTDSLPEPQVTCLAIGHCDLHSPNGFAPTAPVFTFHKLFALSRIYRICCAGLPSRCARRYVHQAWSHLPGQSKTRGTLPTSQGSNTCLVAESPRVIGPSCPTLDSWTPYHFF